MKSFFKLSTFMFAPTAVIFVALFLLPISHFFVVSFWRVRSYQLIVDSTLDQYIEVFSRYSHSLVYTLLVAIVIAIITTGIAYSFAYYCRFKAQKYGGAIMFIALLTLFGGYLTKIYMWKTILGSNGILNSALIAVGLINEPIEAFLFSPFAVVVTLTHYTLPLAVLPIYGSMRGIADIPLQAARDLGATKFRVFYDVILPQTRIGLISAISLTFIFSAGDYVTPMLVGGPNTSMMGLFIQSQFGFRLNPPLGSAMSFTVIFCCLLILIVFSWVIIRVTRQK
jgi:spermidine/putrescine transport system permease protein